MQHGYYYDQNRAYPAPGTAPRRPGRERRKLAWGIAALCCTLSVLLLAAVVLRWVNKTLDRSGEAGAAAAQQQHPSF